MLSHQRIGGWYYTEVAGIKRGTIQQIRASLVLRHPVARLHLALVQAFRWCVTECAGTGLGFSCLPIAPDKFIYS
jgi:hypothetical protein